MANSSKQDQDLEAINQDDDGKHVDVSTQVYFDLMCFCFLKNVIGFLRSWNSYTTTFLNRTLLQYN